VAFHHVECPCGRTLRAGPDQAGTVIRCWSCGREVAVPYPRRQGQLVRALAGAAWDAVRPPTAVIVVLGSLAITAALLVPGVGPWLALGLVVAAAWEYENQFHWNTFAPKSDPPRVISTPDPDEVRVPAPPETTAARAAV